MTERPLIACHQCGQLHVRPVAPAGGMGGCSRCGYVLFRQTGVSLNGWIAIAFAGLVVFAIANWFPIAQFRLQGLTVNATLPEALWITWQQGRYTIAVMAALFAFVLPLGHICFVLWALRAIQTRRLPYDFNLGMRVLHEIPRWSMVPVLVLAILVAVVKMADLAVMRPGPAMWAYAGLTVLMTILGRITSQRLWRHAEDEGVVMRSGQGFDPKLPHADCAACGFVQSIRDTQATVRCERCHTSMHFRKPQHLSRAWALVIAASILYIPANVLPVMNLRMPTGVSSHTILGGVIELWRLGSADLAIVVFVASVMVPMTKLLALGVLMVRRRWDGVRVQRQRTRLYELVEFIGQWSMLDVFVVILLSSMGNFPGMSQITAGPGAAAFGLVVILTMLAAMSYDPRIGWDQAKNELPAVPSHRDNLPANRSPA